MLKESRPTNLMGYVQALKKLPFVDKVIKTQYVNNGIATLIRDKNGNAYEIILRPAAHAKENWGPLLKKKG